MHNQKNSRSRKERGKEGGGIEGKQGGREGGIEEIQDCQQARRIVGRRGIGIGGDIVEAVMLLLQAGGGGRGKGREG